MARNEIPYPVRIHTMRQSDLLLATAGIAVPVACCCIHYLPVSYVIGFRSPNPTRPLEPPAKHSAVHRTRPERAFMNTPRCPGTAAIMRGFYYEFEPKITKIGSRSKSCVPPKTRKTDPKNHPQNAPFTPQNAEKWAKKSPARKPGRV